MKHADLPMPPQEFFVRTQVAAMFARSRSWVRRQLELEGIRLPDGTVVRLEAIKKGGPTSPSLFSSTNVQLVKQAFASLARAQ